MPIRPAKNPKTTTRPKLRTRLSSLVVIACFVVGEFPTLLVAQENGQNKLKSDHSNHEPKDSQEWTHPIDDHDTSEDSPFDKHDVSVASSSKHDYRVGQTLDLHPGKVTSTSSSMIDSPNFQRHRYLDHSSRNRIARSCYHPDECAAMIVRKDERGRWLPDDVDVDEDDAEDYPSPPQDPRRRQRQAYYSTFVGMILQVFRANQRNRQEFDHNENNHLPACSNDQGQPDNLLDDFAFEQAYELVEPLHLVLGNIPKHALDYAYTPVVVPYEKDKDMDEPPLDFKGDTTGQGHDLEQMCTAIVPEDDGATSSSWWKWWFSFTTSAWWKNHGSTESDFDMGKNAFAGGSHGEVWRGRRICKRSRRRGQKHRERHFSENDEQNCDENQPLILKRLKIDRGYRLLEAGLREVYFGNLLQSESESLCTVYVDHFFREVPRGPTFGRRTSAFNKRTLDLELWIVFEDAGPSLRSYLYSPITSTGGFVMYQHSPLWTQLRMSTYNKKKEKSEVGSVVLANDEPPSKGEDSTKKSNKTEGSGKSSASGRALLRDILRQILTAAAALHESGIVHRDIKPSNVMCISSTDLSNWSILDECPKLKCLLGDFSSAWNNFTVQHLYTNGPSPLEQTDEYAPPEAHVGPAWVPFHQAKPQSYDSWSIGVLALELLLGTPNVFSVDQRTTVLLTNRMQKMGASPEELQRALYLAALSHFCIYVPSSDKTKQQSWPLRHGDPLHNTSMVQESCTLQDFHRALRARDPLGVGFDSSADLLLHLIWQLLAWDPMDRITAADALSHPYFDTPDAAKPDLIPGFHNALESQMLDPRLDFNVSDTVNEFICPKCGRVFSDWRSCNRHAVSRRHAKFCVYDRSALPACIGTHPMLPAHSTSGFCDLQGRRATIEDIHSIHLRPSLQFYGIFDGHTGNFASKFVAANMYKTLAERLSNLNEDAKTQKNWKFFVELSLTEAFADIHKKLLEAVSLTPTVTMDQSGTTATLLFATDEVYVVASLGDSRAVLSSTAADGTGLSAIQLTIDHVASDPDEQQSVLRRGGFISSSGGIDRVNGTLAITRSIGDADLAPFLGRNPYVVSMTRNEIKEQCGGSHHSAAFKCFVILASDGLWDVMNNQEAVDMVAHILDSHQYDAFQEAAHTLAIEAYVRGSTDNIGVCVVAIE